MPLTLPCALGRVNISSYRYYLKLLLECTVQHEMKIKKGKETNGVSVILPNNLMDYFVLLCGLAIEYKNWLGKEN